MSKINDLIKELCPNGVKYRNYGEVFDIKTGKGITTKEASEDGTYPIISGGITPMGYYKEYNRNENTVTVSRVGANAGYVSFIKEKFYLNDKCFSIIPIDKYSDKLLPRFIYHYTKNIESNIMQLQSEGGVPTINTQKVSNLLIPIPPIEVQEEIVRILDKFGELEVDLEVELEARKSQYEFWRGELLNNCNGSRVKLCDLLDYIQPAKYIVSNTDYSNEYCIPVLTAGQSFVLGYTNETNGVYEASKDKPVIIFDDFTTSNHWVDFDFKVKSSAMKMLVPKTNDNFRYIYYLIQNIKYDVKEHSRQWIQTYSNFEIVLPSIEEQKRIVNILDKFDKLVNDITVGLPAEIELRRKQYEYYRNKLLSFEELIVNE